MKKKFILHPFIFSVFPILFLLSHNIEEGNYFEAIILSVSISLGLTAILFSSSLLFFREMKKSAIVVSLFIVLFYSYGHFHSLVSTWHINDFIIGRHRHVLIFYGIVFLLIAYRIIKSNRNYDITTSLLNTISVTLIILPVINIATHIFRANYISEYDNEMAKQKSDKSAAVGFNISNYRDIYYIILDGYAASSVLKNIYNYDNTDFIDHLTKKGFYVASESRSNYSLTFLSLASSLNMTYLNHLTDNISINSVNRNIPYQLIKNNKTANFLKNSGYEFIHLSSGWGPTDYNEHADLNFKRSELNEFYITLIGTTILSPFDEYFGFIGQNRRNSILNAFSELAKIHKIKKPTFSFAHIVSPHPPYLFDAQGNLPSETSLKLSGCVWAEKEKYIDQLRFINKKVKVLIDEILMNSKIPPIIILQADHGSASTFTSIDDWENPSDDMLIERMRIFNAYYLPASKNKVVPKDITPVNSFRFILDYYFNTNYGLLEDYSYFSSYGRPYKFIDVTNKVKYH